MYFYNIYKLDIHVYMKTYKYMNFIELCKFKHKENILKDNELCLWSL